MYQWDKSIKSMDVPATEVERLYRSMRDVQLALPGMPAQEATAYLCQHRTARGVGTVAVFHLHKSNQLAFYVESPIVVAADRADSVLDQTLMFVESMGFLMTDLDIHLLTAADREMLWASLPLQHGLEATAGLQAPNSAPPPQRPPQDAVAQVSEPVAAAGTSAPGANASAAERKGADGAPAASKGKAAPPAETIGNEHANVDDLLAAVEELRTRRPGIRPRRKAPGPEELKRRRRELCENIGRIWSSL